MGATALAFLLLASGSHGFAALAAKPGLSSRGRAAQFHGRSQPVLAVESWYDSGKRLTDPELLAATAPRVPSRPCGDALDKRIWALALPAFINFLVLPITGAVDLFFIGQLGNALAAAGQAAANQVYSTAALLTNVIPIVTVPLVAKAYAAGDTKEVQRQIGGAIFLSMVLSSLVALLVGLGSSKWLLLVGSSAALPFSLPYLLWRLPGVLPDALSTVGFSSFRGVQDAITPLKISLVSCTVNAILNPILMFMAPFKMGIAGAALATSFSQVVAGVAYFGLLLKRGLLSWASALRPPSKEMMAKLAAAAGAVQVRNVALNVAFVAITKVTQGLDATGVAAAAHATTIALWQLGGVILFAMGSVATILTSAEPPAKFYEWLDQFLADSPLGAVYASDISWNAPNASMTAADVAQGVLATRLRAGYVMTDEAKTQVDSMRTLRDSVDTAELGASFPYMFMYLYYEQYAIIVREAYTNLALALVAVFIICTIVISHLGAACMVMLCVILVDIDILGLMNLWDLTIDSVAIINLVLAIGLAVDYSAHVAHAFMQTPGTRQERVDKALEEMGTAVIHGAFSTFLAVVVLSVSKSYIFRIFFKQFFGIVVFGGAHGLILLPTLLSLIGPDPILRESAEDAHKQVAGQKMQTEMTVA